MARAVFIFTGRVQGVGFRATTRDIAQGHDVTGWVRNQPDGSVKMAAQGTDTAIGGFLAEITERMGRYISGVDRVEMREVEGESGFEIQR